MNIIDAFPWIIQPGDCIMDIGAFDGSLSRGFTNLAGLKGQVHSFEPHPIHYAAMSMAVNKLKIINMFPYCKAISDQVDHCSLYTSADINAPSNMASTILKHLVTPEVHGPDIISFRIETDTIDNFCRTRLLIPQVIKIDTEGAEANVVRGGQLLIKKHLPVLIYESGRNDFSHSAFLEQLGYQLFVIDVYYAQGDTVGKDHPINCSGVYPITSNRLSAMPSLGVNLLAVHPERHGRLPILTKISDQRLESFWDN